MTFAQRQRAALCDLFEEVGALAPTLCQGWTAQDLAAHLWVRGRRPGALPGIGLSRFAERTERIQQEVLDEHGFLGLVEDLRRPGWIMRPVDRTVNAVEYFVHHEDVLRPNGSSQQLTQEEQAGLWRIASMLARKTQLSAGMRLALHPEGHDDVALGRGNRPVHLSGLPSEMLLYFTGRLDAAEVTQTGEPDAVEALRRSITGL
ncbi:MAG: TIGR03085 family metal-binding protein [Arachnia sp.]